MRQIGTLESKQYAERFSNFLAVQGVPTQVEESQGQWSIWVREEDHLDQSREELERFRQSPDAESYVEAAGAALRMKHEEQRRREKVARNTVDMRQNWNASFRRRAPLTTALIAICVLVGLFSDSVFAPNQPTKYLRNPVFRTLALYDPVNWNGDALVDVKKGQLWRLFTPAFLHIGFGHIIFNMFALQFFGGRIESRQKWGRIAIIFFVGSSAGMLGQYIFGSSNAVGFSGVGYCLFGYLWAYGMIAPEQRFGVEPQNAMLFLGWLVAGFAGILEKLFGMRVANWAHLFGLLAGVAIAAIAVWYDRQRKRKKPATT